MIVLHWVGSAGVLYIIANILADIFTSNKLTAKSLTGRVLVMLVLWLVLART